jgi:alpha,alpha-trehalase
MVTDLEHPRYPPLGDYGLIGDGRSAALVHRSGAIDWLCLPDFDSPAVFCRLLDWRKGGFWLLGCAGDSRSERAYLEHTNVLVTAHHTPTGHCTVTDFMPVGAPMCEGRPRLCRVLEGRSGVVQLRLRVRPTFGFATVPARFEAEGEQDVRASGGEQMTRFMASFPLREADGMIVADITLHEGQRHVISLADDPGAPVITGERVTRLLDDTIQYWRRWADSLHYDGLYSPQVVRSALALKMLIYEPTGAIVAAPTTSLPEHVGGQANWDYRYVWLRDAALVLDVLQGLHRNEESVSFFLWLERLRNKPRLQPVYTIRGEPELNERELDHLEGYRGSRPVRVGNAAAEQIQLDLAGHLLDACRSYEVIPRPIEGGYWDFLRHLADGVANRWRQADQSIWETRMGAQQFLHSKLFCWVALDRALQLAEKLQLPGELTLWQREREEIRRTILQDGFNEKIGSFTAVLRGEEVDAAVLQIPLVGFLPATDPRVQSSMRRVQRELADHGLVYRNQNFATGEKDNPFLFCSFWLVDNLAMAGQLDEAQALMEKLVAKTNDLGLLAEEVTPDGREMRGNFPQGFSHLGLIRSALRLTCTLRPLVHERSGGPGSREPRTARSFANQDNHTL